MPGVVRGWEHVAKGNWDALVADYHEDKKFIMPGQEDVLEGKASFRAALDGFGGIVPPAFEILEMDPYENDVQNVFTVFRWKCDKIPQSTWTSVRILLRRSKIHEERWFVDTVQWRAAF